MKIAILSVLIIFQVFQSCVTLEKQLLKYPNRYNNHVEENGRMMKVGLWIESVDSASFFITNYKRGVKEGKSKLLLANGEVWIYHYKNDKRNGWAMFYNDMGFEYSRILFKDDQIVRKIFATPRF